jgi:hypothetical protein
MFAWSIVTYGVIQCSLIQFYAAISGKNPSPLRLARKCLHSWLVESHTFCDPMDESNKSNGPGSVGKNPLTLQTKAYTVVAMLTEIAENHLERQSAKLVSVLDASLASPYAQKPASTTSSFPLGPQTTESNPGLPLLGTSSSFRQRPLQATNIATISHSTSPPHLHPSVFPANMHHSFSSSGTPQYANSWGIEQFDLDQLQSWAEEIMRHTPA